MKRERKRGETLRRLSRESKGKDGKMSVRVIAREAQVVETMAPIGGRYGDDGDTGVLFIGCCASVGVEAGLSEEKGRGRGDDARAEINKKSVATAVGVHGQRAPRTLNSLRNSVPHPER